MYILDFKNDNYTIDIKFDTYVDRDIFQDDVNYLKQLYLFYNKEINRWVIERKRIDEILLWFEKDKVEYETTDDAINAFKQQDITSPEIKYFRNKKFDETLLNKDIKLFEFQKQAITWRLSRNRYLDSFDAGLGKTCVNICVFTQLYKEGLIDSILLIVPSGLLYHWKHEILYFVNVFNDEDIQLINNSNKVKPFAKYKDKKILIIANHILADLLLSYKENKTGRSAKKVRWKQFVDIKKDWGKNNPFLLIDESHEFKNSSANKTKALISIKDFFDYRVMISATPWINRIEDAYSQISFLDKSIIGMSEGAFKIKLAEEIGNKFDRFAITSYNSKKVQEFLNSIKPVFDKKLKEEIPEMKTKKIIKSIYLEMDDIQDQLYQAVVNYEIHKLEEEFDNITWKQVLNKLPTIMRVIDNPSLIADKDTGDEIISRLLKKWNIDRNPKFNTLKYLLSNYIEEQDEKVVVYCVYPKNLDFLYSQFQKYNPLIIHGSLEGIKDKDRDRAEKEWLFNNDDKRKVIFLSALTSSQGINLQKKYSRIIVYSTPFSGVDMRQLVDRTTRITSERDSIIEILVMDKTLDNVRVNRALNRIDLNDRMGKEISKEELKRLLKGIV